MKKITFIIGIIATFAIGGLINSCSAQREAVANKIGAQLCGENCIRCHNTPSPADYNDVDWDTIGLHMQIRANLTEEEITKIVAFLQSAN